VGGLRAALAGARGVADAEVTSIPAFADEFADHRSTP